VLSDEDRQAAVEFYERKFEADLNTWRVRAERAEAALREIAGNADYAEDDMVTRLVKRQNIARAVLATQDVPPAG
jgi:hypothetical protein